MALPNSVGINPPTPLADHKVVDVVYSAFVIALLDIRGKEVGRPLYDLLGRAARKTIPFGGYLFYKLLKQDLTFGPDIMGGVLHPDQEVEIILKLREAFPAHGLRIDPIGAWTVATAVKVVKQLEDPCRGMDAMVELSAQIDMPLATNLAVIEFEVVIEAVKKDAVQIVLSDHHYRRGATGGIQLGEMCRDGEHTLPLLRAENGEFLR